MRYLENFDTVFRAKEEELIIDWDYYTCTNCHSEFRLYRPKKIKCPYCQSLDINSIDKSNLNTYEEN